MQNHSALTASLREQLAPADAHFAVQFGVVIELHPQLATWLFSIAKHPSRMHRELLLRAARLFDTDLPDFAAAQVLERLAEDAALYRAALHALRAAAPDIASMPPQPTSFSHAA